MSHSHKSLCDIPRGPKRVNKTFSYNSGCLAVFIRFFLKSPDALWLWHRRKRFVIVVFFKMAPQRDNQVKVSALFCAGYKVSEVANLVGLAQPSRRSRSTWTIAKISTDVQAVVERLLSLEWHSAKCPSNGIPQAKQSLEWDPASCHDPQQSFEHCLHVFFCSILFSVHPVSSPIWQNSTWPKFQTLYFAYLNSFIVKSFL